MRDRPAFAPLSSSELPPSLKLRRTRQSLGGGGRRSRPLTVPEALAASLFTLLSAIIAVSYVWARLRPVSPFAMLGFAIATGAVVSVYLFRRATRDTPALLAFLGILASIAGWLLWLVRPGLLPPSGRGDLTHHLMLVDYIERHWQLPDASMAPVMGEMAHYTPGLHLLTALLGAWTGTDGLRTIYPLVVLAVALKAALVFLIALRVLPDDTARVPLGLTAIVLLLLPQEFFLGSFFQESFLAQAVAELFAVAMWWALVAWDDSASRTLLLLFAAAGVGTLLTWPIWIGPPIVTFVAMVLTRDSMPLKARVRALGLAIAPVAAIAVIHGAGRTASLGMAGVTGAVLRPSVDVFGWPFLVLAAVGILLELPQRRGLATLLLTLSIVAQGVTLFLLARSQGASTPYMALKMVYLSIYPLAVFGAIGIATIWRWVAAAASRGLNRLRRGFGGQDLSAVASAKAGGPRYVREVVAWALLLAIVVVFRKPLTTTPRPAPVVSLDLYNAGRWARGQLEAACVDYLVPHADTMYSSSSAQRPW